MPKKPASNNINPRPTKKRNTTPNFVKVVTTAVESIPGVTFALGRKNPKKNTKKVGKHPKKGGRRGTRKMKKDRKRKMTRRR